ncbi:LysE family translocator [Natronomonas sp. EA1]|uniref:LysE family translocator n=1 Tax=Natronomonas sp. EA1 TaxID=3421655 RepID=UPI003EB7AA8B
MDLPALAYVTASVALILTPGPDTAFVLAQSLGGGRAAGVRAAAGVSLGVLVHTVAAVVGLSVVFEASPVAYRAVTLLGAAYLLYLGVVTLRGTGGIDLESNGEDGLRQGFLTNVLNPKVALFFIAFLPGFGEGLELLPLGVLYAVLTMAYLGPLALLSGAASDLVRRPGVQRLLRLLSGGVLCVLGVVVLGGV